jgi:hypothetical protein
MRFILTTLLLLAVCHPLLLAQQTKHIPIGRTPSLGVKTNMLYDLTSTVNLGAEVRLSGYLSLDVSVNYNPWTYSKNGKLKHFLLQPELRYWIYEPFNGHYLASHVMYSRFNIGNPNLPFNLLSGLDNYRYQGNAYGVGFSYGYQWILSRRWNLEASIGLGYLYLDYSRYECRTCGRKLAEESKHFIVPTKVGISLIYIIK